MHQLMLPGAEFRFPWTAFRESQVNVPGRMLAKDRLEQEVMCLGRSPADSVQDVAEVHATAASVNLAEIMR